MQTNAIANQYLKSVKKACPRAFRPKLTAELNDSILEFLNENPNSNLEDIQKYFGEPIDFVSEFLNSMDSSQRIRLENKRKYFLISISVVLLISLMITTFSIYIALESSKSSIYYYSEEIVYLDSSEEILHRELEEIG